MCVCVGHWHNLDLIYGSAVQKGTNSVKQYFCFTYNWITLVSKIIFTADTPLKCIFQFYNALYFFKTYYKFYNAKGLSINFLWYFHDIQGRILTSDINIKVCTGHIRRVGQLWYNNHLVLCQKLTNKQWQVCSHIMVLHPGSKFVTAQCQKSQSALHIHFARCRFIDSHATIQLLLE